MPGKYIAIAGNMGSGKSSLTAFLCRYFKLRPFYEPNEINPYLADFYKDMGRWAYHSQVHFLTYKFRLHQELEKCSETVIQDRTIYEDAEVFATNLYRSGYIKKRDFDTYYHLYQSILEKLRPPDLLIYLDCSIKTLNKRIKERGREIEKTVSTDYVKRLNQLYKRWLKDFKLSPVIAICTDKYDYMDDFITRQDIFEQIEKYL